MTNPPYRSFGKYVYGQGAFRDDFARQYQHFERFANDLRVLKSRGLAVPTAEAVAATAKAGDSGVQESSEQRSPAVSIGKQQDGCA